MTDSQQTTLVLGGTGRTGSLVAQKLIERGLKARTASRHGADVLFDWDDATTHARALDGVDRVYLVTPVMRVKYAGLVSDFLDLATGAGCGTLRTSAPTEATRHHRRSTSGPSSSTSRAEEPSRTPSCVPHG
jgi:uncharacterized protein YbjT (DUF2867 family)